MNEPRHNIVFFGHNRLDAAIVRRLQGFLMAGAEVQAFTFRRDGDDGTSAQPWPNTDLGHLQHAKFGRRALRAGVALRTIWRNRTTFRQATTLYARNLDMAIIALVARALSGSTANLVYECLDVHEALTASGPRAVLLRWLERMVLRRANLLVHSSPAYIEQYFKPVQGFDGPSHWVENKILFSEQTPSRRERKQESDRLRIVWPGVIRCQQTLDLLRTLATARPDIEVHIHGRVSYFLLPDFDAQIEAIDNIKFHGPYEWPMGLANVYADADFAWSQELSWRGHNSDWLIPNRVYEASYFGVPSIALEGTETGRLVRHRRLGWVLPDADADALSKLLDQHGPAQRSALYQDLIARPASDFVHTSADTRLLLAAMSETEGVWAEA